MRVKNDLNISLTPDEIQEIILRGYTNTYNPRSEDKVQITMYCARDGLKQTQSFLLSALEKADYESVSSMRERIQKKERDVDAKLQSAEHSVDVATERVEQLKKEKKISLPK